MASMARMERGHNENRLPGISIEFRQRDFSAVFFGRLRGIYGTRKGLPENVPRMDISL
jgi:hypothetical protein